MAPIFIALALLNNPSPAAGAQCCGDVDPLFTGYYGANARVFASVRQTNDQVIIGGEFTNYGGATYRNYLARINSDGTVDYSFAPFVSGAVYGLALQPDGKIIAVGALGNVGGPPAYGIARFHSNGYLDTSFTSPALNYYPTVVELQADGKILIGGGFTTINNKPYARIARLQANGALDSPFNPGADGLVYAIKAHANSTNVFIGGAFNLVGGFPHRRIARISTDTGMVEPGFNPSSMSGPDNVVRSIEIGEGPVLYIGGDFTFVNGHNAPYFAHLFWPDGAFNKTLNDQLDGPVHVIRAVPNDPFFFSFLIGGKFSNVGSHSSPCFARIQGDSFAIAFCQVGSGFTGGNYLGTSVDTLSISTSGVKTFAGGNFTDYNGHAWNRVGQIFISCSP